ncbi:sulfatase [Paenibacillus allorhizosphaerae]|uniref:Endo-4-O-sulfatase n=1 Tax=Paenibacillus allorhizosphaerae TaxID=2849866 RepID=A0ABM8VD72_9BACL|nr:sulfatase [Paenibacillus allorhizosphaerae]CAG7626673.1 Endo-4-O-sulfatase [Paenibacillus allorhizosphaerae]
MRTKKPNLLFVFPDQWRKQAVGFRNEDEVATPNIDRFACESLSLDHAISCFPLCSPNRSVMLTGRYPLSTGVTTNCKLGLPVKLGDDELTIGNLLKQEGYQTGYIGKWHLDLPEQSFEAEPASGAKHWDAYIPPGPRRFGFDFWYAYNAFDKHMSPHYWRDTQEMIEPNRWSTEHETDVAIDFIRGRDRDKPFCLFVSWNPPHQPFEQVPEHYKAMYADRPLTLRPNVKGEGIAQAERHQQDYFAAVTATDDQFGRLLEALEQEGLSEDTIVVLTSDHGEMMGSHGWMEHKNIWYEESIAVPFLIRYPGRVKNGTELILFNSADIVPTLLGLMNADVPDEVRRRMQGTDFSPIFCGKELEAQARRPSSAFICHYPGGIEEHRKAGEQGHNINAYGWRGIRTERYTYVAQKNFGAASAARLLYDNETDPYQLNPRTFTSAPQEGEAKALEDQLKAWLVKLEDPFSLD